MTTDFDVISRVLRGNTDAYRELVMRYQSDVVRLAKNLIRDSTEAEDIAQDAFVAAFQNLNRFDERRAGFRTWLLHITRNRCFNALKKRQAFTGGPTEEALTDETPERQIQAQETRLLLDQALDALPLDQRMAFVLREIQGLTYEQISQIEQAEIGTIKSRISRAKSKLRSLLKHKVET